MPSQGNDPERGSEAPSDLQASVAVGSAAQVVLAVAAVLAVCYVAKLVMITLASALLLAFVLEPVVWHLERWRVPRPVGACIAVTLLLGCVYGVAHFSYNSAIAFINDLPKYSHKIRGTLIQFRQQAEQLQKTTETVLPESQQEKEALKVRPQRTWTEWLTNSASGLTELLVALSFIPFLVYFMLSWKDRMHVATMQLFSPEHRRTADETLSGIASMLHSFLVGNLLCGVFVAGGCVLAFGLLKIPYFYFLVPQRVLEFDPLSWHGPGHAAAAGRRCWYALRPRDDRRRRYGVRLRHVCGQRAVSEGDWQAPQAESARGDHCLARLGLALGRYGTDPCHPNYGCDENCLRSY